MFPASRNGFVSGRLDEDSHSPAASKDSLTQAEIASARTSGTWELYE